jgi:hypothetical protein
MENPCENCICLASCKTRELGNEKFIQWAIANCSLYKSYVLKNEKTIDREKANELGKLFRYEIIGCVYHEEPM